MNLKHWTLLSIVCIALSRQLTAAEKPEQREPLQPARLNKNPHRRQLPTPPQKATTTKSGRAQGAVSHRETTHNLATAHRVGALTKDRTQRTPPSSLPTPVRRAPQKLLKTGQANPVTTPLLPKTQEAQSVTMSATSTAAQAAVVAGAKKNEKTITTVV